MQQTTTAKNLSHKYAFVGVGRDDGKNEGEYSAVFYLKEKYEVLGSANVEKLFEVLDINEEADVVTVSGWVMDNLGKLPVKGDVFDYANLTVTVLEMNGRRVSRVEIIVKEKQDVDGE